MINVITWNVRDLFLEGAHETRLGQISDVIKECDPYVVCVQEIRGSDPGRSLSLLAEATGLDWRAVPGWVDYEGGDAAPSVAAVGVGDAGFHVGILWRYGITPVPGSWRQIGRAEGGLWHAAASIALDAGGLVPLTVVCCHLDPFRPEWRFAEAARIASLAVGRTAVVGGDFNCVGSDRLADGTYYDPDPLTERDWHDGSTFQALWDDDPDATPRVDRRAAERLRRAGLVDAAAVLNAPWQPSSGHWPDDPHGVRRVDRILATSAVLPALVSHEVIDTDATSNFGSRSRRKLSVDPKTLSDHLPVMVTLDETLLCAP